MYKILIVEDNVKLSGELSHLLEKEGYHAAVVEDFENVPKEMNHLLDELDEKYLIVQMMPEAGFTCGEILNNILEQTGSNRRC